MRTGVGDGVRGSNSGPYKSSRDLESSYEIRGGRGRQIWPPFGPGVTYGPNSRGISSLWGARTAETAGSPNRGTGRAWRGVSVERTAFQPSETWGGTPDEKDTAVTGWRPPTYAIGHFLARAPI